MSGVKHCCRQLRWCSLIGACWLLACLPREHEVNQERVASTGTEAPRATATQRGAAVKSEKAAPRRTPRTSADPQHPKLTAPFQDDFERSSLGNDWVATSKRWRIEEGRLCVQNARNHPIWLAKRLPTNARIRFSAVSYSPDGDIKAEFWGNGRSAATGVAYRDATSYLTIFGGWKNQYHVLARIDEHASDRPEVVLSADSDDVRTARVQPGRRYQFEVERSDGHTVIWRVDGQEILRYVDDEPLAGSGHEHFGFNDWAARVCFDNLEIVPLGD